MSQVKNFSYLFAIYCAYNSQIVVALKKKLSIRLQDRRRKNIHQLCCPHLRMRVQRGSEWKHEDCIYLKNIVLAELGSGIQKPIRPAKPCNSFKSIVFGSSMSNPTTLSTVPSRDNLNASSNTLNESAKIPKINLLKNSIQ